MIYSTNQILTDLKNKIINKEPFSTIRLGDAGHGIITVFKCHGVIDVGKWSGSRGKKLANSILGQLTVPTPERDRIVDRVVTACNRADYIDTYDAFDELTCKKGLGVIGRRWREIHENAGIYNTDFCNPFLHYFSIVSGEMNLFNLMKGKNIFCITSKVGILDRLKMVSGARVINHYRIPRRGRGGQHFKGHYRKVMKAIRNNVKRHDLFLVGAGFLGKIYCDEVKRLGGRAFDSGRLFDFWSGSRNIDSRPKRFIQYNPRKMLCDRIKLRSEIW